MISTVHTLRGKSGWSGRFPGRPIWRTTVVGETSSPVTFSKKPHPPITAVDEGKILHEKAAKLRARVCVEVSLSISAEMCIILSLGPLCGCERDLVPRGEASAVNLTGLVHGQRCKWKRGVELQRKPRSGKGRGSIVMIGLNYPGRHIFRIKR